MEVVILCGGLGTRLREETEFRPKPMVPIGSHPIVWHIMKSYAQYGHKDFVLALGYRGDMFKEYFWHYELLNNDVTIELGASMKLTTHSSHSEDGWRVTLADTGEKALKGARLKRVERYVKGDTFLLTYGDGLADVDLDALVAYHRSHGRTATVTGINPASRFGELKISGDAVESFSEKPDNGGGLINGGFFVFERKIFDRLSSDESTDLEYGVLEQLAAEGELMVYRHGGFWSCMDTLRDMDYLNQLWAQGNPPWRAW